MKKKITLLILVLFHFFCFAESELKYYFDITNGFKGQSSAEYCGARTNEYCHMLIDFQMRSFPAWNLVRKKKFSNQQIFLINSALREYEIWQNEVYMVCTFEETINTVSMVRIIDNKGNYEIIDACESCYRH